MLVLCACRRRFGSACISAWSDRLNLVFGVIRIVHLAHGDCLMLGAFIAVGVVTFGRYRSVVFRFRWRFVIFLTPASALLGVGVRGLQGSVNPEMLSITCSSGLSQVIEAVRRPFSSAPANARSEPCARNVFSPIKVKLFGRQPNGSGTDRRSSSGFPAPCVDCGHHQPESLISLVYV